MVKFIGSLMELIIVLALAFGLSFLLAYPVMWAVNYLFASSFLALVFGTAKIGFWQAWVLSFVTGALFSSNNGGK